MASLELPHVEKGELLRPGLPQADPQPALRIFYFWLTPLPLLPFMCRSLKALDLWFPLPIPSFSRLQYSKGSEAVGNGFLFWFIIHVWVYISMTNNKIRIFLYILGLMCSFLHLVLCNNYIFQSKKSMLKLLKHSCHHEFPDNHCYNIYLVTFYNFYLPFLSDYFKQMSW